MSKKQAKAQASSARAASTPFGLGASTFSTSSSPLSYVTEPPDLSAIPDPNVIVYFRNLSKKDSTTKAKALEDIQAHLASLSEPVEAGLLEAWIKMFPRTSIDNAKAVRQSAQTLQGHIATAAGKRIARYMPSCVGPWLCGLYDSDRSVAEATQNSLRQVFNTPEKIQNIRKAYQQPILEYCRDAIDKETPLTLSDERTVSPDDAEAKYSRVVSACVSLLGSLLANVPADQLSKHQNDYDSLLGDRKLWEFATHSDASIRRSIHRFLRTALSKQQDAVQANLDPISKSYLSVALNSDQTGSAYDYVETLAALTSIYPTVWTEHYTSKTSVDRRLRQFLKKGSQFGPREYWDRLVDLLKTVPKDVLPNNGADAAQLLVALHGGIIRKDESRLSLETAFSAYLQVSTLISDALPETERYKLLQELVLPLLDQYLKPNPENAQWNLPQNPTKLLSKAISIKGMSSILEQKWPNFTQQIVDNIKTSAPEQSKEYEKSQDSIIQQAARFATLQELTANMKDTVALRPMFVQACKLIITEALEVVENRYGKPYGAAGAVAELLCRNASLVSDGNDARRRIELFLQESLPDLITTPSCAYVVDILYGSLESASFQSAWGKTLKAALKEPDSPTKTRALEALLTSSRIPKSFDLASSDAELQEYVKSSARQAIAGSLEWDSFNRILQSPAQIMSDSTTDDILSSMTQSLYITQEAANSLQGLRHIVKQNPSILKNFVSTPQGSSLLQNLLLASESPDDEIARDASAVNSSLRTILSAESDTKQSIYDLIHEGLTKASQTSVSVETLVDLAKQSVQPGDEWEKIANLFPDLNDWNACLEPFLTVAPKSSLAITNPLGGAVYLAASQASMQVEQLPKVPRDADGYSPAYRVTQYVTRLFKDSDLFNFNKVPEELQQAYLCNISLAIQLADDNLGLAGANGLWAEYNLDVEADAMAFMSDAQPFVTQELMRLVSSWSSGDKTSSLMQWAIHLLSKVDSTNSPRAYYTARAYSVLVANAIDIAGWNTSHTPQVQDILKSMRKNKEHFSFFGFMNAFKEPLAASRSCERMCNELIADLTGIDIEQMPTEGLVQLIMLNTILYSQEDMARSVAKQRLIFFVKHVIAWLKDDETSRPLKAEVCRVLIVLLPSMNDIYGEHWGDVLNALSATWVVTKELEDNKSVSNSPIPFIHASLKLYAQLRSLTQDKEPNDDLLDAWKDNERPIADGLINLLKHSQHFPDEFHQPLKMVNDVLARQISKISLELLQSSEELLPLLYVESQPVQQTAFDILHKQIPAAQEQISIDAALEKSTARLPEELLSLIIESPTMAALADASFERSIPLPLRGYLLSWLLVFDHLAHASFRVKNDYIDHIKEGDYHSGLLSFMFDFLGHAHNKPVDVSKLDITTYTPDMEPPKRDTQWLLTHIYFLCLRHIPSLAKAWFIDCKSRPIAVTLEPWTEKHISPPVIAAALQSVAQWAERQAETDDDSPFAVKVQPRAREITASYVVDEQTMAMRIVLPAAFPLANAHIEGVNRVAVNEQKWQSWLRTSLGAITIFNGSLIDALTTFKRNVDGAMKGQSECSICYSIVGSDRKLPDKRCSTCKNLFHGSCLFKWFKSSSSSSCPLCRNPFNYG